MSTAKTFELGPTEAALIGRDGSFQFVAGSSPKDLEANSTVPVSIVMLLALFDKLGKDPEFAESLLAYFGDVEVLDDEAEAS